MDKDSIPTTRSIEPRPRILDYLFFLRPVLHPPVWTVVIMGYFRNHPGPASISRILLLLVVSSCAAGSAYVLNQISDIESDRINNKLFFLPRKIISIKSAYVIAITLILATLLLGFSLGPLIGAMFVFGVALGFAYSFRPVQGKNRPFIGTLVNGIAHGCLPFVAGNIASGGEMGTAALYSVPYMFAVIAVFVGTTIPDIPGDLKSGKITPGVALGIRKAAALMAIALLAAIFFSVIFRDFPLLIASLTGSPFYLFALIKLTSKTIIVAVRMSILLLSLAAGLLFWPYLLVLLGLFAGTRAYYRRRFDITYPRFT